MTKEQANKLEQELEERGYKKITQCKATENDDFEWYKAFRYPYLNANEEYELKYQLFFQFWDFEKYGYTGNDGGWSVSIEIMPESCKNNVGRRDVALSVDWSADVDKVEHFAERYYDFLIGFESGDDGAVSDAAHRYAVEEVRKDDEPLSELRYKDIRKDFIAGAEWEREHGKAKSEEYSLLMENAVKCEIEWYDGPYPNITNEQMLDVLDRIDAHTGDKVKVIIVKDDEEGNTV